MLSHDRSKWDCIGEKGIGHLRYGQSELHKIGISNKIFDNTNVLSILKNFTADLSSFKSGVPDTISEIQCFTDGSKFEDNSGFGLGIFNGMEVIASDNGCTGENTSVFMAEIIAIHRACELLYDCNARNVTIWSDSQSAIAALAGYKVTSKVVENCIKNLNLLGLETKVDIKWVRGHSDHTGNEYADFQAKIGTKNSQNKVETHPPLSWAKLLLREERNKEWCQRW